MLQQTHAAAIVFARRAEDWLSEIVGGEYAVLDLPEVGITVPLRQVYATVDPAKLA